MKRRTISIWLALAAAVVAVVLEALPYGAVLNFANPEGEPLRELYSYFDMTPFGYANFGPMLTALGTVAAAVLYLAAALSRRRGLAMAGAVTNVCAVITSLMPLMFGLDSYPLLALGVTLTLAGAAVLGFAAAGAKQA